MLSKIRAEAAKRLKVIQNAEDAADDALLKFGSNVRDFLRDAVSIQPPVEGQGEGNAVLFESKDAQGKRVIHASRYDAQLHVVHTSADSFTKDQAGDGFTNWAKDFDVDKKTEDISSDLSKYPELRATMEKLVPDQVPYGDFWKRYYFLRHSIETAEARRRDLLKGKFQSLLLGSFANMTIPAASAEDEVRWDDDSDDEDTSAQAKKTENKPDSAESSTTIHPPAHNPKELLKPAESRKSHDEGSDTSYDVVGARSGVPSQAPSSPKETKTGGDESDEDWE